MKKVAIVGCGPRGLSALESICRNSAAAETLPQVLIFEGTGLKGCGWIYDFNQPASNWLNIPEREINIPARPATNISGKTIPAFPSFKEWSGFHTPPANKEDIFPGRWKVGRYLNQRFEHLVTNMGGILVIKTIDEYVDKLTKNPNGWILQTSTGSRYSATHVLLTIGHQSTRESKENLQWLDHSETSEGIKFFNSPYPVQNISKFIFGSSVKCIGIKGFGLSMIDLVRNIIENSGGSFTYADPAHASLSFTHKNASNDLLLVPFSLDGLCPVPKPLSKMISDLFEPADEEVESLRITLTGPGDQSLISINELIGHMAFISSSVYTRLPTALRRMDFSQATLSKETELWMNDQENKISYTNQNSPEVAMRKFVEMAMGSSVISPDYCLGQVWRSCMHLMYTIISHGGFSVDFVNNFISLDERLKRYSFGPPVKSVVQLQAMIDAGVMTLDYLNNPKISVHNDGWSFSNSVISNIMVNTVLDPPSICHVSASFIQELMTSNIISPYSENLGARTEENGYLKNTDATIALIGRLAEGSVVGSDSIHSCFDGEFDGWAKQTLA